MSQKIDDLEAVRLLTTTLEPFDNIERERIIRWACEKLGMKNIPQALKEPSSDQKEPNIPQKQTIIGSKDIKAFLAEKEPKSENQLVAAVAYYYKFEASESERKNAISKDDLLDACRKSNRQRPKFPSQVLINANSYGLVDKAGTGLYEINSVGENLVAVSMPLQNNASINTKIKTKKNVRKKINEKKNKK